MEVVTRDGFWSEKDEMSQAYASRATGNFLWQVDIDEFYKPEDMSAVIAILEADPEISGASFPTITFWGSPQMICDGFYLRRGAGIYHRLFRWGPGYTYVTHRPPTVHNEKNEPLRSKNWITGKRMRDKGIYLYHYSLLFPSQVERKSDYYSQKIGIGFCGDTEWAKRGFEGLTDPFRVHNVVLHMSWLRRFDRKSPPAIETMWRSLEAGAAGPKVRPMEDADHLVSTTWYRAATAILDRIADADAIARHWYFRARRALNPSWRRGIDHPV